MRKSQGLENRRATSCNRTSSVKYAKKCTFILWVIDFYFLSIVKKEVCKEENIKIKILDCVERY